MSFDHARIAIEKLFKDEWTAVRPAVPISFQNVAFTPPPGKPYVALSIVGVSGRQAEILGGANVQRTNRYLGFVQVDACTPEETGTKDARDLLDVAAPIFRSRQTSYGTSGLITFLVPSEPVVRSVYGRTVATMRVDYRRDARE